MGITLWMEKKKPSNQALFLSFVVDNVVNYFLSVKMAELGNSRNERLEAIQLQRLYLLDRRIPRIVNHFSLLLNLSSLFTFDS
jgi:hypothetical protein